MKATRQPHHKMGGKLVARKITLNAKALFAVLVEDEDGRRPQHVKAVKSGGVLFDVNFSGYELLFDEFGQCRASVGLGFQPSTTASGRRSAEVDQYRTMFQLCFAERGINIFYPVDSHEFPPLEL